NFLIPIELKHTVEVTLTLCVAGRFCGSRSLGHILNGSLDVFSLFELIVVPLPGLLHLLFPVIILETGISPYFNDPLVTLKVLQLLLQIIGPLGGLGQSLLQLYKIRGKVLTQSAQSLGV